MQWSHQTAMEPHHFEIRFREKPENTRKNCMKHSVYVDRRMPFRQFSERTRMGYRTAPRRRFSKASLPNSRTLPALLEAASWAPKPADSQGENARLRKVMIPCKQRMKEAVFETVGAKWIDSALLAFRDLNPCLKSWNFQQSECIPEQAVCLFGIRPDRW
jgi:hypothetical protein